MKITFLCAAILLIYSSAFSQKVGIGTTTPLFKLDVIGGSINTDSVYRIGTNTVLSVRGFGNLLIGNYAGQINTGTNNTFSGYLAGYLNTTGNSNSFFGSQAGRDNTEGYANSFFGTSSGLSNTTGYQNSFLGYNAGASNTSGIDNSFLGFFAGLSNTTGVSNSFFGGNAGQFNTTGNFNSFFGMGTGNSNTTGSENSFFGRFSGLSTNTGSYNSFFGQSAGNGNITGSENSFFGRNTGFNNTTGRYNTATGYHALIANTTGTHNTAVGDSANVSTGALTNATAIGSLARVDCSNCMVLGSVTNINGATSGVNVGIGVNSTNAKIDVTGNSAITGNFLNTGTNGTGVVGSSLSTSGQGWGVYGEGGSVGVEGVANLPGEGDRFGVSGHGNAGTQNFGVKGDANGGSNAYGVYGSASGGTNSYGVYGAADGPSGSTWAGYFNGDVFANKMGIGTNYPAFKLDVYGSINTDSVYRIGGNTVLALDGSSNLFVGTDAGTNNLGYDNTFSGIYSGHLNVNGFSNSFYGSGTGANNTGGDYNSFFGTSSGTQNTIGNDNSFFGVWSGVNNIGSANSFFGSFAGSANTSGLDNSFFGQGSGNSNFTGTRNTALGFQADVNTGALTNATAIGANSQVDCSNCMVLGSVTNVNGASSNVNVGIGINAPDASLHVARGTGGFGTAAFHGTNHISHFNFSGTENTFIRAGKNDGIVFINDIPGGTVIIGTGSGPKLTVNGDIWTCGNITSYSNSSCSDIRYKTNLSPLSNSLDKVLQLHGINYDWKREEFKENNFSDKRQLGFSAQEVETLFPELVMTNEAGYKSVDYSRLTPVLVEAIKEQQKQIEAFQQHDKEQQQQIDQLKKQNEEILLALRELQAKNK